MYLLATLAHVEVLRQVLGYQGTLRIVISYRERIVNDGFNLNEKEGKREGR